MTHSRSKTLRLIYKLLFLSFLLAFGACNSNRSKTEKEKENRVEVIKVEGLTALIKEQHHSIHVINFWATWCGPCVKELPQFAKLAKEHPEIDISLVSIDFVEDLETKVIPFIEKKGITFRVLLIDDIDYNKWIDLVDPSWTGAIPATLIIEPATGKRIFLEKEFENDELEDDYIKFINS